ncbi:TonB-dependent receptor [Candidatus Marinimicrobia bacterium MT.SAG.3]|nr:TonB-dependent receptor [Candidatus Marinimicrobia bacterium MT.SAG.3]
MILRPSYIQSTFTIFVSLVLVLTCYYSSPLIAGTTGKISGSIRDISNGEPLIGANIIIEGTYWGAAADEKGRFVILNIPPGIYTVRGAMIGYTAVLYSDVRVSADFTTKLDFQLQQTGLELREVTVLAKSPIVRKDLTSSLSIVSAEQLKEIPVEEFSDVLALQAGIVIGTDGAIHIRGGRSSEVAYLVDGLSVTDPFSGNISIEVENNSIQELQVISGPFNAEYGQAMSGVIDVVIKEGGDRLRGNLSFYKGEYVSSDDGTFLNIDEIDGTDISNIQLTVDGPLKLFGDKFSFFLTGRFSNNQGWLYGQRRFLPSDSSNFGNWNVRVDDIGADGIPNSGDFGEGDGSATPGEPNVYVEESGDGVFVPMNPSKKLSSGGKLTYRISQTVRISYGFFVDMVDFREYSHLFKLNPDGDFKQFNRGHSQSLIFNHTLSSKTFYTVKFASTFFDYKKYVFKDPLDSRYVNPKRLINNANNAFRTGGTEMWQTRRNTESIQGKIDLTSQVNNAHLLRSGIEFRRHTLFYHEFEIIAKRNDANIEIRPFEPAIPLTESIINNRYKHNPLEAAAYIQDKMEFENLIVNIGLRYDYFNASAKAPIDLRDPDNARYYKVFSARDSLTLLVRENEYESELGEITDTVNVRGNKWVNNYRNAGVVQSLSPRIGISYPITDRGVIHFSYGHFSQIPTFEHLYVNSEFEVFSGSLSSTMGNAELKPQRTVIYEVGLQQQVSDYIGIDITGFYKDMEHLLGMEIITTYTQDFYARFINRDYGNVGGITLALEKRRSNYLSGSVDYTFQLAEGNASDPMQVFNDAKSNKESEIQVIMLDWDQTHTLNFNITLSQPGSWGMSLVGRLGSGFPYTPRLQNATSSFVNSERKPTQYTFDLKIHKELELIGAKYSFFIKLFNILDRKNEILVYSDTGRAGYTIRPRTSVKSVNTLDDFRNRPDFYSEPRRVILGASIGF